MIKNSTTEETRWVKETQAPQTELVEWWKERWAAISWEDILEQETDDQGRKCYIVNYGGQFALTPISSINQDALTEYIHKRVAQEMTIPYSKSAIHLYNPKALQIKTGNRNPNSFDLQQFIQAVEGMMKGDKGFVELKGQVIPVTTFRHLAHLSLSNCPEDSPKQRAAIIRKSLTKFTNEDHKKTEPHPDIVSLLVRAMHITTQINTAAITKNENLTKFTSPHAFETKLGALKEAPSNGFFITITNGQDRSPPRRAQSCNRSIKKQHKQAHAHCDLPPLTRRKRYKNLFRPSKIQYLDNKHR
jgi:hypothetical protein